MTKIIIITVNDVYKLDNYPKLCTFIKKTKKQNKNALVLTVLPGDFLSPNIYSTFDNGVAMVNILNIVEIDYVTFGNHEFDLSYEQLQERMHEYNGTWLNTNVKSPIFTDRTGNTLPEYVKIEHDGKLIHLYGFCTTDLSCFSPKKDMPVIEPSINYFDNLCFDDRIKPDLIIPLTHQSIHDDRKTCEVILKNDQIKDKVPVVIGGHEHTIFLEKVKDRVSIVKVGMDAEKIGLIEIEINQSDITSVITLFDSSEFENDSKCQAVVDGYDEKLNDVMKQKMFELDPGIQWSSKNVRSAENKLTTKLLSIAKKNVNCDLIVINGGGVRAQKDYHQQQYFTYGDLLMEFTFQNEMTIVDVPGKILEDTIRNSRDITKNGNNPGFLHGDDGFKFESGKICMINNRPFNIHEKYKVAIDVNILYGMNDLQPIVNYFCGKKFKKTFFLKKVF